MLLLGVTVVDKFEGCTRLGSPGGWLAATICPASKNLIPDLLGVWFLSSDGAPPPKGSSCSSSGDALRSFVEDFSRCSVYGRFL